MRTVLLVNGLSGRIALRADASGITLGGTPLRYKSTTRFVPWSDIERIVVWPRWQPRGGPLVYIGLAGPADAPQADSRLARLAARANALAAQATVERALVSASGRHICLGACLIRAVPFDVLVKGTRRWLNCRGGATGGAD